MIRLLIAVLTALLVVGCATQVTPTAPAPTHAPVINPHITPVPTVVVTPRPTPYPRLPELAALDFPSVDVDLTDVIINNAYFENGMVVAEVQVTSWDRSQSHHYLHSFDPSDGSTSVQPDLEHNYMERNRTTPPFDIDELKAVLDGWEFNPDGGIRRTGSFSYPDRAGNIAIRGLDITIAEDYRPVVVDEDHVVFFNSNISGQLVIYSADTGTADLMSEMFYVAGHDLNLDLDGNHLLVYGPQIVMGEDGWPHPAARQVVFYDLDEGVSIELTNPILTAGYEVTPAQAPACQIGNFVGMFAESVYGFERLGPERGQGEIVAIRDLGRGFVAWVTDEEDLSRLMAVKPEESTLFVTDTADGRRLWTNDIHGWRQYPTHIFCYAEEPITIPLPIHGA